MKYYLIQGGQSYTELNPINTNRGEHLTLNFGPKTSCEVRAECRRTVMVQYPILFFIVLIFFLDKHPFENAFTGYTVPVPDSILNPLFYFEKKCLVHTALNIKKIVSVLFNWRHFLTCSDYVLFCWKDCYLPINSSTSIAYKITSKIISVFSQTFEFDANINTVFLLII